MTASRLTRLVALALFSLAGLTAVAHAANTAPVGDPHAARTIVKTNMRTGPGTNFSLVRSLPPGLLLYIEACTATWCAAEITGTKGFVARQFLDFGGAFPEDDTPPPNPKPKPHPQPDKDAQVCFFTAPQFGGPSFCASPGDSADFLRKRFDDAIESILIDPGVSVEVCTEEDLDGQCQTFTESRGRLPRSFRDEISSYSVDAGDDVGVDDRFAPPPRQPPINCGVSCD